jgi:hypothetical protein
MELSPSWEANNHSASQEIPRLLWIPDVHCRVHNSPPLVPILAQMRPVHTLPPYFSKIYYSPIYTQVFRVASSLHVFRPKFCTHSSSSMRATCPSCFILLYLITLIIFGQAYKLRSSSLCSLLQFPATYTLLAHFMLVVTLCPTHWSSGVCIYIYFIYILYESTHLIML